VVLTTPSATVYNTHPRALSQFFPFVCVFVQILNLTVIPTAVLELTAAADAELGPHLLRLTNVVGALSARRWIHVVPK
jgi:hypothetical protein